MKIVVVGANGTIGSAVAAALAPRHEVVAASRSGPNRVDIRDSESVESLLAALGPVDAIVNAAGGAAYKPLADLTAADFQASFDEKLMGQINLARTAIRHLMEGGSITLTSGWWSVEPIPGVAAISMVNAALEGFTRAAALELPRGIRINTISPPLVGEPERANGQIKRMSATDVAKAYVDVIEGPATGQVVDTRPYAQPLQ